MSTDAVVDRQRLAVETGEVDRDRGSPRSAGAAIRRATVDGSTVCTMRDRWPGSARGSAPNRSRSRAPRLPPPSQRLFTQIGRRRLNRSVSSTMCGTTCSAQTPTAQRVPRTSLPGRAPVAWSFDARLDARDHRRDVARDRLQVPLPTGRQVGVDRRSAHGEVVEVDHVEIGALADLDRAAVVESVEPRGAPGLLLDHELERDGLAARPIAGPVRELRAGARAVTDELHVRAGVREPDDRRRDA